MKVGIIGAGRLGITFALLCERAGYDVIVSDKRKDYISNILNKICMTNEPLIQEMLSNTSKLMAVTDNIEVIKNCDIIFTFVATPSTDKGNYDISSVLHVVDDFFKSSEMNISLSNKKFVVGCTTNPGDVEKISQTLNSLGVYVAYNPEFIAQGEIVKGLEQSDIVLIGTNNKEILESLIEIYEKIQTTEAYFKIMSPTAAEITKIGINCFLTAKISFANMIGDVLVQSELQDEIDTVLEAIGGDSRIGGKYMKYGFGFGGPCLPRDNRALGHYSENLGINLNLPITVDKFNHEHSVFLKNFFIKQNPDKKLPFVMKFVTYKKGTDILEESQQLKLCIDLLEEGYTVIVHEIDEVVYKLNNLVVKYDGRLKFNKENYKIDGFLIDL
jgi:UDPglucose 6-dehydrogenase